MADAALVPARPVLPAARRTSGGNGKLAPAALKPAREKFLPSQKRMFRSGAVFATVVIGALMVLSLSHLADGISRITGVAFWRAVAMALGIDMGLVAAESSRVITATTALYQRIRWHSAVVVWTTLVLSMFLNSLAFCERSDAEAYHIALGIALGVILPLLVFLLTRLATTMWVAGRRESGQ